MRTLVVVTIWALMGSGCVPVLVSQRSASNDLLIRVPAKPGLSVSVPVSKRGSSVWYRSEPVPCIARDDGTVEFRVDRTNRHSPYLVYELGPADMRPCRRASGATSKAAFHATVHSRPAAQVPQLPRDTDYLILGPAKWLATMAPLVAHREAQGHRVATVAVEDVYSLRSGSNPDPVALREAVRHLHRWTRGDLRFLLLVGDVQAQYKPEVPSQSVVPTFYGQKLVYPGFTSDHEFASDHPYSMVNGKMRIAVGRLPARNIGELEAMVGKIVSYETQPQPRAWRRRLILVGGPADFSPLIDRLIEAEATHLLDTKVPYDFDINLMFATPNSPYAYRLDKVGKKLVADLNQGALFAAYVGHGMPTAFDEVYYRDNNYEIGNEKHIKALNIPNGKPFFLSLTCHTGYFDRPEGNPSLAEQMMLNAKGPVAVFASSRESHPYANALYARAFIEHFLKQRPDTIGQGILQIKGTMSRGRHVIAEAFLTNSASALRREHLGLYNLFGDPATKLRYPATAKVALSTATGRTVRPGHKLAVAIHTPHIKSGKVTLTIETRRSKIRGNIVEAAELDKMPLKHALRTMAQNHAMASNKIVSSATATLTNSHAALVVTAPESTGRYYVKVLVTSEDDVAAGHAAFTVATSWFP